MIGNRRGLGMPFFRFETQALQNGIPSPHQLLRFVCHGVRPLDTSRGPYGSLPWTSATRSVLLPRNPGTPKWRPIPRLSFRFEVQALQNGAPPSSIPPLQTCVRDLTPDTCVDALCLCLILHETGNLPFCHSSFAIIKRAKAGWTIAAPAPSHGGAW